MYEFNHLVHNCWTCATWSFDPATGIAGPDEEADMHSYQPINRDLRELRLINPLTHDYH